jgi:anti-anti-sigma factor
MNDEPRVVRLPDAGNGSAPLDGSQASIRAERDDSSWMVRVSGELDSSTASVLVAVASELAGPGEHVRLSAAGLTFIDSAGLRAFLQIHDRARRSGAKVMIVDPSDATRRLLELVGLAEHLLDGQVPSQ